MTKEFMPDTLKCFRYVSWPMLSPDGARIAYVVKEADEESGLFIPQLRLYDLSSDADTVLAEDARMPYFLPDGNRMTWISGQSGEDQVWLHDLTTGESRQLTTLRHGVQRYRLSADGTKLVFEALLWPEEVEGAIAFTEMSAEEKQAWEEEIDLRPYYVTELVYKMDEWYGMRKGEYEHIGVIDLATGEGHILPTGMASIYPAFSPDGSSVAFYGYPYHNAYGYAVELQLWNLETGEMTQISEGLSIAKDHCPIFTPDGQAIITMAYQGSVLAPYRISLADRKAESLLNADDEAVTHGVHLLVTSRTENGEGDAYAYLSEDGEWLYFLAGRHARSSICRVPVKEAGCVEMVLPGDTDIQYFCRNGRGDMAYAMGDLRTPPEMYFCGKRLTDHNAWLREYPQGEVEEHWIRSRDGKAELHYFLMHPVGQEHGVKYPAVLDVHGGPTCMYSAAYWHEFHALSARGFAVIYGDPRGSVGYGKDFCAGGVCWMPEAMNDLEDMLADAISRGFIDEKRVGVTGGSYGGYMTNKLIGRTKHFAAAVTQRSLINPATSYGTGDIGFISAGKIPPRFRMLDYLEDRARGNPITYIDNIDIPVLILHAFKDYRCSFEQGEQFFIAMKERHPDVPVRLVMFPEENHALTRTGKLHNQIRHLQELVDWFDQYLRKEEASDE
ncbi:MAG: S9 family peptidase [Clostridia bacterium]|nr:S9 family peptidase [Clostridia bacterium]